jgi:hypothetical protein
MPTGDLKSTSDLALMAFYLYHNIELVKVERKGGRVSGSNGYAFVFRDPDGRAEELRIQWANSEMRRYDGCIRTLRKVVEEMRRSDPRGARGRHMVGRGDGG